jgi:hypothetical protein
MFILSLTEFNYNFLFLGCVKRLLGMGSFGAIYLVEHINTCADKALKIFFSGSEKVFFFFF